ncbi:MAG: hypothetical protein LBD53_00685 [Tannerella sp.]|jgi:hypothetical protein|nr:hypothetical protein [Tannerella sp.]
MKKILKIMSVALIALIFAAGEGHAQKNKADKNTFAWRYEIEPYKAVGAQGLNLIKVWSYYKKADIAIEQAKKNAVHGIIFRGFGAMNGVRGQRPLAGSNSNLEEEKKEFFKEFFADGGKYMKFVNITNDGSISPKDRLKVGKEYKIGVVVSVNVDLLRKDLEDAGVIQRLSDRF